MRIERSMVRYRSRRPSRHPLRTRLRERARVPLGAGYQQLHMLLSRERWRVNHTRVHRLYSEGGMGALPALAAAASQCGGPGRLPAPTQPNQQWPMDFMHDTLADRRAVRILTGLDVYARVCVAIVAARPSRVGTWRAS